MEKITNRELVMNALERKRINTIPKFFLGPTYIMAHSGLTPEELRDTKTFVNLNLEFAKKHDTCINYAGIMVDVTVQLGAGLIDREGNVSKTGEETVLSESDIEKLNTYCADKSFLIKGIAEKVAEFKKCDPDTPTIAIVHNTPMVVSELMGITPYYKALLRKKEFVAKLSERVEPEIFKGLEKIAEIGCDMIWLPMPTMGGTCVSKKMYLESCHEYSKRIVDKVHELGMKAIIHTCGNWNDRFDIVMQEGADALHLSEAILPEFAEKYGKDICMIGNISLVDTLLYKQAKEVYEECYNACISAAKHGNYIIAPDCGVPAAIPEENIEAMFKATDDANRDLFGDRK